MKTAGTVFSIPAAVGESVVAGTVLLVRGPLALRNVIYMPKGIDLFSAGAAVFAYETAEGRAVAVDFPGPAGESGALERLRGNFEANGFEVTREYDRGIVFVEK